MVTEDSQNTHPEMHTELKEIDELSNWGAKRTQESQMNEPTRSQEDSGSPRIQGLKGKYKESH